MWIGLIDGVAESTSSLLKLASGVWADRVARRKPLVVFGYGLASVVRPLMAIVRAPWQALAVRFVDRIGARASAARRATRSSPRPPVPSSAAPPTASIAPWITPAR
jgi:hypothetical protein